MNTYSEISKALKRTENDLLELRSKKKYYKKKEMTKYYETEKSNLKRYIKQYEAKLKMPKYQKQKNKRKRKNKLKKQKKSIKRMSLPWCMMPLDTEEER